MSVPGHCATSVGHRCRALVTPGMPAWFQICPTVALLETMKDGLPPPTKTNRQRLSFAKSPLSGEHQGRQKSEKPGTPCFKHLVLTGVRQLCLPLLRKVNITLASLLPRTVAVELPEAPAPLTQGHKQKW